MAANQATAIPNHVGMVTHLDDTKVISSIFRMLANWLPQVLGYSFLCNRGSVGASWKNHLQGWIIFFSTIARVLFREGWKALEAFFFFFTFRFFIFILSMLFPRWRNTNVINQVSCYRLGHVATAPEDSLSLKYPKMLVLSLFFCLCLRLSLSSLICKTWNHIGKIKELTSDF